MSYQSTKEWRIKKVQEWITEEWNIVLKNCQVETMEQHRVEKDYQYIWGYGIAFDMRSWAPPHTHNIRETEYYHMGYEDGLADKEFLGL